MQNISAIPSHLLLNRKDEPDSHSTRSEQRGPSSAFATYAFGPIDTSDGKSVTDSKAVTGTNSIASATGGGIGWLAQLAAAQQKG
ncbi:hypothetical protein [Magnetospirillum molischianum]|uniref:Uncharacterized protein n=1 Tax=Magnetospirillum molischianum DSM 120 TaxID=1150626 RepID=H8FVD9_MAGML|nr:hypothetical protein [Magnetospirillum molischianum]CCG42327.1 conserved hypothetical protein [Magnetospirillum molischianum DSM 120]